MNWYAQVCTPVHIHAHVSYHFHIDWIFHHIITPRGFKSYQIQLAPFEAQITPIFMVFLFFFQKWSIVVILSNGTWRSFENEKNVDFHHILTHWKLWYFSWDLRWLKFRTRTFKKCKWFVFKFINCCFIIVNCQVAMRKGHKNADMERYAPIWSDMVWCGEFSLQCGEFSLQYGESYERSPHWN